MASQYLRRSSGVMSKRPPDTNSVLIRRPARRKTLSSGRRIEPFRELTICRASLLDPSRARDVDHHLPFSGGHPALRPRHFQNRDEWQQLHRFQRKSQFGELATHLRIGDPYPLAEFTQLLLGLRLLSYLLDEFAILLLEVVLFVRAPARQGIVRHDTCAYQELASSCEH
jgi:hypothetical protein